MTSKLSKLGQKSSRPTCQDRTLLNMRCLGRSLPQSATHRRRGHSSNFSKHHDRETESTSSASSKDGKSKFHRRKSSTTSAQQLQPIDEYMTTEADKLQIKNEERQLGCLLVQKTKGETQLQVCRWLSTANMLGNLEATQLAVHSKQVEHPLRASSQHHEDKL